MANFKNTIINDTGFITLPAGTFDERPASPSAGMIRFNTEAGVTEFFDGNDWKDISSGEVISNLPTSGFIFTAFSRNRDEPPNGDRDPDDTSNPNWQEYFGDMLPFQPTPDMWDIQFGQSVTATFPDSVFNYFSKDWTLQLNARNGCWYNDRCWAKIEFLDVNDNTIAAIETRSGGNNFRHLLSYGPNLSNLTNTGQTGAYPNTDGNLTFTDTQIIYTNTRSTNYNNSFTFNCDVNAITKLRISGVDARTNYGTTGSTNCGAQAFLRIIPD